MISKLSIAALLAVSSFISVSYAQTEYPELFHDCIGCEQKSGETWYCGDTRSTNYGKCSEKPFANCKDKTWHGIDNMDNCMDLFHWNDVDYKWPSSGSTVRRGVTVNYDPYQIVIEKPFPGWYVEFELENDEDFERYLMAVTVPSNAAVYIMGTGYNEFIKVSGKVVNINPNRSQRFYFQANSNNNSIFKIDRKAPQV